MTRSVMVQVSSGKQHNLKGATYPAVVKDGLIAIKHSEGILEVSHEQLLTMAWGPEDPSDPSALAAVAPKPAATAGKAA